MNTKKIIFLITAFLYLPSWAYGLSLMKCYSPQWGTLWGSFGSFYESSSAFPQIFPTEITHFSSEGDLRGRYVELNYKKALQETLVEISYPVIRMTFKIKDTEEPSIIYSHKVVMRPPKPSETTTLQGSWHISDSDQQFTYGEITCSTDGNFPSSL